ncbi:MAG: DegT/DnrJ/EryC1/StrS family aminotransferase [Nanoarchaeota archaeon]
MIPLLELQSQYKLIQKPINTAINRVLKSGRYLFGTELEYFEKEFTNYIGTNYTVGTSSGTSALAISLRALGVHRGHDVLVPANTAIPTATAVLQAGARPIFCDINNDAYTLDPKEIANKITPKTKAVIPVHLYGQAAAMDPINKIAKEFKIAVVEDCAQACGATYKNKKVGTLGDIGCFSFFPSKNLACYGDGGAITTNNKVLKERALSLRYYGQFKRYHVKVPGWNARLSEIQAAILRVKLKYLDAWNNKRIILAKQYNKNLKKIVKTPYEMPNTKHVYHLYVIRTKNRESLRSYLTEDGINTEVHYPIPLHKQEAFLQKSSLPNSERLSGEILSLPLYPELPPKDIKTVCDSVKEWNNTSTN